MSICCTGGPSVKDGKLVPRVRGRGREHVVLGGAYRPCPEEDKPFQSGVNSCITSRPSLPVKGMQGVYLAPPCTNAILVIPISRPNQWRRGQRATPGWPESTLKATA